MQHDCNTGTCIGGRGGGGGGGGVGWGGVGVGEEGLAGEISVVPDIQDVRICLS